MAPEWSRVVSRNKSLLRTLELPPEANIHSLPMVYAIPLTGLLTKTDMSLLVITCQRLLKDLTVDEFPLNNILRTKC